MVVETLERALLDRSAEGEAAGVLVGTALNDDDAGFVEPLRPLSAAFLFRQMM
ncbi:hypothetical protein [Streptomyces sp. NPDC051994]|uniref:hypothetical protein n=1 Tax=unclassified Streptomyces TaxID=2593676 RepID=UPI00344467A5